MTAAPLTARQPIWWKKTTNHAILTKPLSRTQGRELLSRTEEGFAKAPPWGVAQASPPAFFDAGKDACATFSTPSEGKDLIRADSRDS